MRRWLARRFRYTQNLERRIRRLRSVQALQAQYRAFDVEAKADVWPDLVTLLQACLDYKVTLERISVPDPVGAKSIRDICNRYGVKVPEGNPWVAL